MTADLNEFRRGMSALEPRGATERIPDRLRELALRHVKRRRAAGSSWQKLGAELGVCATTLQRWNHAGARTTSLSKADRTGQCREGMLTPVPVVVAAVRPEVRTSTLVLVSPYGFRLEGLAANEAVALFERLR